MGFKSPNFTQTPNDFFDDLLKTIDELGELKVTLVALRQTFGYHRDEAELSVLFFEKMSGLSRNSVRRGIDLAIKRGTIRQVREATPRTGAVYEVAIIDGEGQPMTPRGSADGISEGQPVPPLNKEIKTKDIPLSAENPPSQEKPADPPTVKAAKARIQVAAVEGAASAGRRRGIADPRKAAKDEREQMQGDVVRVWTQGGQAALPDVTSIAHKIAFDHYAAIESGTITREQWRGAIENLMNGGGGKYRNGSVKDAWVIGNDIDNLIRVTANTNNDAAIKARLMAA